MRTPNAPADAARAYRAAIDYDRALGSHGSSLLTLTNVSPAGAVRDLRRGRASALDSLRWAIEREGGDPEPIVSAAHKAAGVALKNDVARAFWEHGLRGWEEPEYVIAWRFGDIPKSGRSYNYRDRFEEPGVSVAGLRDGVASWGVWQSGRAVVWLRGWLREDVKGSDGEPLIVGARKTTRPRDE